MCAYDNILFPTSIRVTGMFAGSDVPVMRDIPNLDLRSHERRLSCRSIFCHVISNMRVLVREQIPT